MSVVLNWDGREFSENLRTLPRGRYVLVPVDEAPELTLEQEAGLNAALASVRAGHAVGADQARTRVDAILGR